MDTSKSVDTNHPVFDYIQKCIENDESMNPKEFQDLGCHDVVMPDFWENYKNVMPDKEKTERKERYQLLMKAMKESYAKKLASSGTQDDS